MEFVRLVHPRNFDHNLGRFNDLAFKASSDGGGMSIFHRECGEAASGVICAHIDEYYEGLSGDPAVFYLLSLAELPEGYDIIETLSDSGDDCHREVVNVSNGRLKKAFKGRPIESFYICDDGGPRPLTAQDIRAFKDAYG